MNWRFLLAVVLSALVLALWPMLFPPPERPVEQGAGGPGAPGAQGGASAPEPVVVDGGAAPGGGAAGGDATGAAPPGTAETLPPRSRDPGETFTLEVPGRLTAVAQTNGGAIARLVLPEYHETVAEEAPYELLRPVWQRAMWDTAGVFQLEFPQHPFVSREWKVQWSDEVGQRALRFTNTTRSGLVVTKTMRPGRGDGWTEPAAEEPAYYLSLTVEVRNPTGETVSDVDYRLLGPLGIDSEERTQGAGRDILLIYGVPGGGRVQVAQEGSSLTNDYWERRDVAWVGTANNYFASILIPGAPGSDGTSFIRKAFARAVPDLQSLREEAGLPPDAALEEISPAAFAAHRMDAYKNLVVGITTERTQLEPGATLAHQYTLFAGPRQKEVLARYGSLGFPGINEYGIFGLVNLFIALLETLKTVAFGSWGLAIICLTFVVKLCLHPINKRSQRAIQRGQKKMQKLKPQMDALKERYADNRMKLNQELQKLFKEHNFNPAQQMGGCLVLFLQLPIWFALYSTLRHAVGLRHTSFLYIEDLTRPDQLFDMGFSVPFLGSAFNLLPLLYVILTIVNQQLQPKPEDPQMRAQFRMMTVMMVFFGVIFYNFPAGFMLYIMTSSALGIIESKLIKAELAREDASAVAQSAVPAAGGAPYRARGTKGEGRAGAKAGARSGTGPSRNRQRKRRRS